MNYLKEIEHMKIILTDFFEEYSELCNRTLKTFDFDFYWFKTPSSPEGSGRIKTCLKLYVQTSKSSKVLVLYKETIVCFTEQEEVKTYFLWKRLFNTVFIYGIQNLYNDKSQSAELMNEEYPLLMVNSLTL